MKTKIKIFPLLAAVMVLFGFLPARVCAIEIGTPDDLNLRGPEGVAGNYQRLYFGEYNGSPLKWRILGKTDTELFLLTDDVLKNADGSVEKRIFNGTYMPKGNNYNNSAIRNWLVNTFVTSFNTTERAALRPQKVTDGSGAAANDAVYDPSGDKAFLISNAEAGSSVYFPGGNPDRGASNSWWLRSPGSENEYFSQYIGDSIYGNGYIFGGGTYVDNQNSARPAIKLNLASVTCISAAVDGIPSGTGSTLAEVTKLSGDMKLTVQSSGQTLSIGDVTADSSALGSTVTVNYSEATTGANNYLCAELTSGGATHRGVLKALTPGNESGTAALVLPVAPKADYKLRLWNEQYNAAYKTNYSSAPVSKSIVYTRPSIAVFAKPEGCGTVTGGGTYSNGAKVTVKAEPKSGYCFVNWTENGIEVSTTPSYLCTLGTSDRDLVANFTTTTHTVSVLPNPTSGGTVIGSGTYDNGSPVSVTAMPKSGWRFVNWTENGTEVSTDAAYTFTLGITDKALVANFTPITHVVTVSPISTANGTVSGGGTYNEGAQVTVRATPKGIYKAVVWTEDGVAVSTDAAYTFTLGTSDRNLVAYFAEAPLKIGGNSLPTGIINTAYTANVLTATGGFPPYTSWNAVGLPAGLTMSADGIISGLPKNTGNFTVAATVTDSLGAKNSQSFTLAVFDTFSIDLASIEVTPGSLSPGFDSNIAAYHVDLASNVNNIDITAGTKDPAATLTINSKAAASGKPTKVELSNGANLIPVVVTSPDRLSQKAYILSVNGTVSNANLKSFAVVGRTITPVFSANQTNYTLNVDAKVDSLKITATADDPKAMILVNASPLPSSNEKSVSLNYGSNSIEVMVVAQDASTKTYTINVTRKDPHIMWGNGVLIASNISASGLTLSWPSASCNAGIAAYKVYRGADLISTVAGSVNRNNVSGLAQGTSYSFSVQAVDTGGGLSSPLSVTVSTRGPKEAVKYSIIPMADAAYTIGETADGIKTMTVNSAVTGFRYFSVNINAAQSHAGAETAVFVQIRNGVQIAVNAIRADFDQLNSAEAAFNVRPGDVIKVYIVDNLTNV